MRTLGEISHPHVRIQLFAWNGKFIVKFEQGPCEQLFKISQDEIASTEDLKNKINQDFIEKVVARFQLMHADRSHLTD
jgi:hypothetical protein